MDSLTNKIVTPTDSFFQFLGYGYQFPQSITKKYFYEIKYKNSNTIYLFISFSFPSLSISSKNDQTRLLIIQTKKFMSRKYAFSASKYHKQ